MRVLVTGYGGFVGSHLIRRLADAGFELNLAGRTAKSGQDGVSRYFAVGEVGPRTDWRPALGDCDAIVHLAGQVPLADIPAETFNEVNDRGTARLVEQAVASSAKRFILMSSLSVVTDNAADTPIDETTAPSPSTPYGRSKLAAESHVARFTSPGRCGIVLRPPIVYGSAARGNWRLLQKLAATGAPLPFGAVHNRRTLIAGENLADAVVHLLSLSDNTLRPGAYMVSDDRSVSLAEILTWLRSGMGMSPRLLPVPVALLATGFRILGKERIARRLLGDLQVDSTRFRDTFGWSPRIRPQDGITRAGAGFKR